MDTVAVNMLIFLKIFLILTFVNYSSSEELQKLQLETIKSQILTNLGMDSPPKVTRPVNLPDVLVRKLREINEEEYLKTEEETRRLILFPELGKSL